MRTSKLAALICLILPLLSFSLAANEYTDSVTFSVEDLSIVQKHGFHYLHLAEGVPSAAVGSPAIPVVQLDVAVPWDAENLGVIVVGMDTMEIEGVFDVVPMTAPKIVSSESNADILFIKDPGVYNRNSSYPGYHAELLSTWELVGQRFAKLAFHPLQYNPVTGKLNLAQRIEFRLFWNSALNPPEHKTFNLTKTGKTYYESAMKKQVLNPEGIAIGAFTGSGSRALQPGQYEHVIITPQNFETNWDALLQWHTRKGFPDIVVTKEYIYANYTGSNQEKIRSFINDAHATWGARYFLIGADGGDLTDQVPYHNRFLLGEDVPNDTFYADYNDNWIVDVHVGRASVYNSADINNFIDKVLYYEKTPPLTDYGRNVFFMGFDLDSSTYGENTKELIRINDLPGHLNFMCEYDSESGGHLSDVIAYLNSGPNLVNHIDHCNWNVWGMGYTNHSESMYSAEVQALLNGWYLINFYTLGCLANAWDYGASISEDFMRMVGGGGVSFTGNTRYGWYVQGQDDLYSSLYEMRWWHVLFTDNAYHVGEALSEHKNDHFPDDEYYQYIYTELNLLGDPAMPLWKNDPALLTVTYDDPIYTGAQSYQVNVKEGGSDLEGALVCLWKDAEVYTFDTTDTMGNVSFTIDPATSGTMLVTATAQDCVPHEGGVVINDVFPPEFTSLDPCHDGIAGGIAVTISGSYFTTTPDTTVTFGGSSATNVNVIDPTTITCDAPAHAAGSVDIVITNSNGSDTLPNGFTYHNAPGLSSISPANGPETGGTAVTITGLDFTEVCPTAVTFGGVSATNIVVVDTTTITCDTPPARRGTPVDVTVTNDFGSDTLIGGFSYDAPPTVTLVDPADGPVGGNMTVTITGTNFTTTPDTTVTFDGVSATSINVIDTTTLTCKTPAHAAGTVDVTVTNSNGSGTLPGGFTYHDPPTLTSVSPAHGPVTGGTSVTVTGTAFTPVGTTVMRFGGTNATNIVVVDSTTITCDTPAHAAGLVDVQIINRFGNDTLTGGFTYNDPPTLTSVSPADGSVAGGTAVTLTGTEFSSLGTTEVTFDNLNATNVVVVDVNTITCDTPAHAAGAVDVTVINDFGRDTLMGGYTYHRAPDIISISPDNGSAGGGTSVTITGADFTAVGTTDVTFDGISASSIVVVDSTTITCDTPAHAPGPVDVTVTNDFGSDTLTGGYTYNNSPTISGINPTDGPVAGGTSVLIAGSDFTTTPDTTVTFGGTAATNVVVVNSSLITCDTPAHAAGAVDVVVNNSNGSGTLPSGYTYHNPPNIVSIDPNSGSLSGGTAVTITGTDFTSVGTTTVTFDGLSAANIVVVNPTTITCDTPAHAEGAVDVVVTNDFGSDTLVNGFTYSSTNPPLVSGISPADGPVAGGTPVTISGDYFTTTPDTTVTFDGTAATNVVVVDINTITCDTPAHAAGTVDVTVTNSNGADTLTGGFTYHNPPDIVSIDPIVGSSLGGTPVTITGTDFALVGATDVTFDGLSAANIVVVDSTTITCETPAHALGPVDVTVTNDFGSDTLAGGYTYTNAPTVTNVDPSEGPAAGGTSVWVEGTGFTNSADTTVTFGGVPATGVIVYFGSLLSCTTPAHTEGTVDVTVTNSNGSGTLPNAYTFLSGTVTVTSITPAHGSVAGGLEVTILGDGFTTSPDTTVTFDGLAATNVTVIDTVTLTCDTPAHAAGTVDVTVTNSTGSDTLTGGFTYHDPPTISSISPPLGLMYGGTSVTITGTNFSAYGNPDVFFGKYRATDVVVASSTEITCTTPAQPIPGKVYVELRTDFGNTIKYNAFQYLLPAGEPPKNLTDVDTLDLYPGEVVVHATTGPANSMYIIFVSFGPGPLYTKWGPAGISPPFYRLYTGTLNGLNYDVIPLMMPDTGMGFINFYTHALVDDSPTPQWCEGGNNPNETGGIMWGLH